MSEALIRRNSKEYKALHNLFLVLRDSDRTKKVSLFIVPAGQDIMERVHLSEMKAGERAFYYDMTWENILGNFEDRQQRLYRSDDFPHLYFFRDPSNASWDKTPFQLKPAVARGLKDYAEIDMKEVLKKQREKDKAEKKEPAARKEPTKAPAKKAKSSRARSGAQRGERQAEEPAKGKTPAPLKLRKDNAYRLRILDEKAVEMLEYMQERDMIGIERE